jgi:hypothetical protein
MLRIDELLDRIGYLERANRVWKWLTLGLAAALLLFLALGTAIGFSIYMREQAQRAEMEAVVEQARRQEMLARQQAEEAARARQAAEKLKAQP